MAQRFSLRRRLRSEFDVLKSKVRDIGRSKRRTNPGPSAIPAHRTPATVSRKGGQIQIRVGGR